MLATHGVANQNSPTIFFFGVLHMEPHQLADPIVLTLIHFLMTLDAYQLLWRTELDRENESDGSEKTHRPDDDVVNTFLPKSF